MNHVAATVLGLALLGSGATLIRAQVAQDEKLPAPEVVEEKPAPSVVFARSWEAAVEEALLLNVPLVVHSHGFY